MSRTKVVVAEERSDGLMIDHAQQMQLKQRVVLMVIESR